MKRTDIDTQVLVAAYQGGTSATDLSRQHKSSVWAIITRLREAGVEIRSFREQNERRLNLDVEQAERFESLVDGILLGDGQIDRKGLLRLEQENSRRGWLDQVEIEIASLGGSSRIIPISSKTRVIEGRTVQSKPASLLYTPAYVELKPQRTRWYPNGKKIVPRDLRLTPMSVAHWFAGDGTYSTTGGLMFCTDGFIQEDTGFLAQELGRQLGVYASVQRTQRPGQFKVEVLRRDEAVKLRDLMAPHLPDCIQYKVQHVRPALPKGQNFRRLTDDKIREIRSMAAGGMSYARISRALGVTEDYVSRIVRRLVYKDLS